MTNQRQFVALRTRWLWIPRPLWSRSSSGASSPRRGDVPKLRPSPVAELDVEVELGFGLSRAFGSGMAPTAVRLPALVRATLTGRHQ